MSQRIVHNMVLQELSSASSAHHEDKPAMYESSPPRSKGMPQIENFEFFGEGEES